MLSYRSVDARLTEHIMTRAVPPAIAGGYISLGKHSKRNTDPPAIAGGTARYSVGKKVKRRRALNTSAPPSVVVEWLTVLLVGRDRELLRGRKRLAGDLVADADDDLVLAGGEVR